MLGDGPWRDVGAGAGLWSNNAMTIGGGTRMYGAQAWRFGPKDLAMASTYGVPEGSSLADWPLTYDELEPYYTRVEQMLGVSGGPSTDPWEGPRSAPLPMGPLGRSPLGNLLGAAAQRLGWGTQPVPLLINTRERAGRSACIRCAQCVGRRLPRRGSGRQPQHHAPRGALDRERDAPRPRPRPPRSTSGPGGRATAVDLVGEHDGTLWRRTDPH